MSGARRHVTSGTGLDTSPMADGEILEVKSISAACGRYRALFDVSFSVPTGGVVALIGSNDAGKSTVARTITGLVTATEGSVSLAGNDVTKMPGLENCPSGRGACGGGQRCLLEPQRRGELGTRLPPTSRPRQRRDELDARAYEAFPILGERRKQAAGTLSGGQQRLLSLAKVLVVPPKLLVADEHLSGAGTGRRVDAVYEGLEAINRNGTAMLVVEQQIDRVLKLAGKALCARPWGGWPTTERPTVRRR